MAGKTLELRVLLDAIDNVTGPFKRILGGSQQLTTQLKQQRDQLKGLQQQQKDVDSFRQMHGAAQQTSKALQEQREKVRELSQGLAGVPTPTRAMTREFQSAVREASRLKQEHGQQQQQLQGLRNKLSAAGISTRNLGQSERELKQRISETTSALAQQENRLKRVADQQRKLAAAKKQYERTQQLAGKMAMGGATALAGGYAMGRPMLSTINTGMTFDSSMAKVQALGRLDKNGDEYKALRTQARELGATTMFTASQAADGQAFLAMAGFDPQRIQDAMPGILDMAKAGDLDIGVTADIGSNILTAMKLPAAQMAQVADVLTGAFTRSNTSLLTLGETMKYAAPGAAQYGVSLETTAAMAAKLGDAGIQGSMGGTSIRRMLSRMAAPNKAAREAMEELGVVAENADGSMRNVPELLKEIYDKSKDMGDVKKGALWKAIAGETGANAMNILVEQAGLGNLQELVAQLEKSQGEARKTAEIMGDNLGGDWDQLKSAWEDVSIELFEGQSETLRSLTQGITEIIRKLGLWIRENPELVSTIVKIVAAIAALMTVIGSLSLALAGILLPMAALRFGFSYLGIKGGSLFGVLWNLGKTALPLVGKGLLFIGRALLMNPIGLVITAIALAAFLIYKYWEPIKTFFLGIWSTIKQAFSEGIGSVTRLLINWSPLGFMYRGIIWVLEKLGFEIPEKFSSLGNLFTAGFTAIRDTAGRIIGEVWTRIKTAFSGGISGVSRLLLDWSPTGLLWSALVAGLEKLGIDVPESFKSLGSAIIDGLIAGITGKFGALRDSIVGIGSKITGWFRNDQDIHSPSRVWSELGGYTMSGLAAASPALAFDSSPPLAANSRPPIVVQGDTINITINPPPGVDGAAIAQIVRAELDRRDREKAARIRSGLYDLE